MVTYINKLLATTHSYCVLVATGKYNYTYAKNPTLTNYMNHHFDIKGTQFVTVFYKLTSEK